MFSVIYTDLYATSPEQWAQWQVLSVPRFQPIARVRTPSGRILGVRHAFHAVSLYEIVAGVPLHLCRLVIPYNQHSLYVPVEQAPKTALLPWLMAILPLWFRPGNLQSIAKMWVLALQDAAPHKEQIQSLDTSQFLYVRPDVSTELYVQTPGQDSTTFSTSSALQSGFAHLTNLPLPFSAVQFGDGLARIPLPSSSHSWAHVIRAARRLSDT